MSDVEKIPTSLAACHAMIREQVESVAVRDNEIGHLKVEMEKLRKLLSQFVNGGRSEKRIFSGPDQTLLPFENAEEFAEARAEAEAEAEKIIQKYTVTREDKHRKARNESLPSHLPRVEKIVKGPEALMNCAKHGRREIMGYDTTETLVYERPKLHVLVSQYPKLVRVKDPAC